MNGQPQHQTAAAAAAKRLGGAPAAAEHSVLPAPLSPAQLTPAQLEATLAPEIEKEIAKITVARDARLKELAPVSATSDKHAMTVYGLTQSCLQYISKLCGMPNHRTLLTEAITKESEAKIAIIHRDAARKVCDYLSRGQTSDDSMVDGFNGSATRLGGSGSDLTKLSGSNRHDVLMARDKLAEADKLVTAALVELKKSHKALEAPVFKPIIDWFNKKSANNREVDINKPVPPALRILAQRRSTPEDAKSFEHLRKTVSGMVEVGELDGCKITVTSDARTVVQLKGGESVDIMYCRPGEVRFSFGGRYAVTDTDRAIRSLKKLANGGSVTFTNQEENLRKIPTKLP